MRIGELHEARSGYARSEALICAGSGTRSVGDISGAIRPRVTWPALGGLVGIRPRAAVTVLLAVAVVATTLVFTAQAGALQSQAHALSGSFGAPGAGAGHLASPSNIAIDEPSGLVYVSDPGNERVDVFKREGRAQYAPVSAFKVRSPGAIAVDNSTNASDPSRGEVYVAGAGSPEEAEEGEINTLYDYSPSAGEVVRKTHVFKFKEKGGEEREEEFEEHISGLSVDAGGTLWVYWEEEGIIDAFGKETSGHGKSKLDWEPQLRRSMEERFECFARPAFAVAPDASAFYVGYERRNSAEQCPGEHEETPGSRRRCQARQRRCRRRTTLISEVDRPQHDRRSHRPDQRERLSRQRQLARGVRPRRRH